MRFLHFEKFVVLISEPHVTILGAFLFLWTYAQCNKHACCKNGCNACSY